jgi:hypothetical protein
MLAVIGIEYSLRSGILSEEGGCTDILCFKLLEFIIIVLAFPKTFSSYFGDYFIPSNFAPV